MRAIVAVGDIADAIVDTVIEPGVGIIGSLVAERRCRVHQRHAGADPRAIQIAGHRPRRSTSD